MQTKETPPEICVAALYRFARVDDCLAMRAGLEEVCRSQGVKGTLLIAPEGINGTIAGSVKGIECVLAHIRSLPKFADLDVKFFAAEEMPFYRMKVRIKAEIVTMGRPEIDPVADSGVYVDPHDWNALVDDPDTIIIDTRNAYEIAVGSFVGAIDPQTSSFRNFPEWFVRERERLLGKGTQPRVAMFCTGGIRCEKASAFLKQQGIEKVFHLKGGVLGYLEAVPETDSRWRGECFVFDQRVAVGHDLAAGTHTLCFACRRPVNPEQLSSPLYEAGASCPACHDERDERQRASYRERHRQEQRATREGRAHVGAVFGPDGGGDDA